MSLKLLPHTGVELHHVGKKVSIVGSVNLDVHKGTPLSSNPCILCCLRCNQYFLCFSDRLDCSGSDDAFGFFADENDL